MSARDVRLWSRASEIFDPRGRRRRGLVMQLVGPDGAGKSTLARSLVDALASDHEVHRFYWRPGLLPMPGRLVGKLEEGLVTDPHGRVPHGRAKALLRLMYYAVDFIVGYWIVYRPILRRGGLVIVERGWQDLVIDSRRYLMPNRLPARLLSVVVPRPDVIIILDAPAATLLERKREITPEEIRRQLSEWKTKGAARREIIELDARAAPGELVAAVIDRLGLHALTRQPTLEVSDAIAIAVADFLRVDRATVAFHKISSGSQASCYTVLPAPIGSSDGAVLKVFHSEYLAATPAYVRREYAALQAMHRATRDLSTLGCPRPLATMEQSRAYVMSRVSGRSLAEWLNCGMARNIAAGIRRSMLTALQVFYEATNECYGDFNPYNILCDPRPDGVALSFIDPCMANPIYYAPASWAANAPLSVDLGYWVFTECAQSLKTWIVRPRSTGRRLAFARELVKEAVRSTPGQGLAREVNAIVDWHAERLRDERGIRRRLACRYAARVGQWACNT